MPSDRPFWRKVQTFCQEPFYDQLNRVNTLYCKLKGRLLYRLVFKRFGAGSCIRRPLLISHPMFISIGDRVSIREGIRLEVVRDNKARIPVLEIGNNANIEQNVHIICHSRIRIGDNVSITGNCAIVDVTHPYSDMRNPAKIGARIQDDDSYVEIGEGSFLGYGTVILPNVKVGKYAIIGANSVVVQDVPDYSVAAGAPAKIIKRLDPLTGLWAKVSSVVAPELDRKVAKR